MVDENCESASETSVYRKRLAARICCGGEKRSVTQVQPIQLVRTSRDDAAEPTFTVAPIDTADHPGSYHDAGSFNRDCMLIGDAF
ncbi:hypothetical protein RRSWK_00548 [Rhodopirellula sp. SWK7]|nr:hypothetical protein RRSWK_00548 [Rhodopirellula sp. SWK7]